MILEKPKERPKSAAQEETKMEDDPTAHPLQIETTAT